MLEQREGGCHCGRVRFRARVDLELLSQCNCSICTKKGILHLPAAPENFELLKGKRALTVYTFGTGVAQHTFCSHCGMHAFYVPRSQPDGISVNARCLDDVDGATLTPTRFFDGRHWKKLSTDDEMAFAMLLSYAWQNDFCFPGQQRLAEDLGLDERSVRRTSAGAKAS